MKRLYLFVFTLLFVACGSKQPQTNTDFDPFVWSGDYMSNDEEGEILISSSSSNDIVIPFEIRSGVKFIPVKINGGPTFDMIFDTGCSGTLISIKEAQYLYQAGLLQEDDYLGNAYSSIADGSIVENMVFNLKELIIGGKMQCTDVTATVSGNIQAPMLLGNEVFDRMQSFTIDNEHQVISFKLQ